MRIYKMHIETTDGSYPNYDSKRISAKTFNEAVKKVKLEKGTQIREVELLAWDDNG